jgi:hypothetical protein
MDLDAMNNSNSSAVEPSQFEAVTAARREQGILLPIAKELWYNGPAITNEDV